MAADYIQRLQRSNRDERRTVLARTSGSLSNEVAADIQKEVEEGCERIDERGW
jgi:Mg-chelatase subunit ChlD